MRLREFYRTSSLLLAPLLLATCVHSRVPAAPARPQRPVELSIVGTADLHGRLSLLTRFGGYVRALRQARPGRVVLLDSGDVFQGTLESDLNEGAAVFNAYRALAYDALAIGNHEFDYGPSGPAPTPQKPGEDPRGALKARAKQAAGSFPVLSANLSEGDRPLGWENVPPSTMVVTGSGVKVGIIGVTTEDTPRVTIAANFVGLKVLPLAESIRRETLELRRAGADVIIVAAHAGGRCKDFRDPDDLSSCDPRSEIFDVARALPAGSVDAIFAGHVHAGIAHNVNGIPILESHAYGVAFSRIDLVFDPQTRKVRVGRLHPPVSIDPKATAYEGLPIVEDRAVAAIAAEARAQAQARRGEPLGVELDDAMTRSYDQESALGNFMSAMILGVAPRPTRLAIMNGGGLRADLPAGKLSYGALYDAMPFDNRLALVTMTGRELRQTLARNLGDRVGILSLAGARVTARCQDRALVVDVLLERSPRLGLDAVPSSLRVAELVPLRDDEEVVVATNDFLATGGDGFPLIPRVVVPSEGPALRDAIAEQLRQRAGLVRPSSWLSVDAPRLVIPTPRPVRCPD